MLVVSEMEAGTTVSEAFECPICSEVLSDPRALPCGHCFCGPSRKCLDSIMQNNGVIKCALCSKEHSVNKSDLRPLYGIRDGLQLLQNTSLSGKDASQLVLPACSKHSDKTQMFWCLDCTVSFCETCYEEDHCDHKMTPFKSHLKQKIQSKLQHAHAIPVLVESCLTKISQMEDVLKQQTEALSKFQDDLAQLVQIQTSLEPLELMVSTGNAHLSFEDISRFLEFDFDLSESPKDNVENVAGAFGSSPNKKEEEDKKLRVKFEQLTESEKSLRNQLQKSEQLVQQKDLQLREAEGNLVSLQLKLDESIENEQKLSEVLEVLMHAV